MSADLREGGAQRQTRADKIDGVMDAIAAPIVWVNSDHQVQGCNAAFGRLVNRPPDAVVNVELSQVLPLMRQGQALAPAAYPTARVLKGDYAVKEYTFQSGQNSLTLEITASLSAFTEADKTIVLTIRDITGLQRLSA